MKKAYFITGAESSGTILVTQAFCSLGIFGDHGHTQQLDDLMFENRPDQLVFRRTFPHGDGWPDLVEITRRMRELTYEVVPILVIRSDISNIESQVRNHQVPTHRIAHDTICHAIDQIFSGFAELGLYPITIRLESFVRSIEVRKVFFSALNLPAPEMEFPDSSQRYRTNQDPIIIKYLS